MDKFERAFSDEDLVNGWGLTPYKDAIEVCDELQRAYAHIDLLEAEIKRLKENGCFETEREAAAAYNKALDKYKILAPRNDVPSYAELEQRNAELERKLNGLEIGCDQLKEMLAERDALIREVIPIVSDYAACWKAMGWGE